MRADQIKVGRFYLARISGNFVTVRVDSIGLGGGFCGDRQRTTYRVTNLKTGRPTTFRSAAKFRMEVFPQYQKCQSGCGKEYPMATKPFTCMDCAKKAKKEFEVQGKVMPGGLMEGKAQLTPIPFSMVSDPVPSAGSLDPAKHTPGTCSTCGNPVDDEGLCTVHHDLLADDEANRTPDDELDESEREDQPEEVEKNNPTCKKPTNPGFCKRESGHEGTCLETTEYAKKEDEQRPDPTTSAPDAVESSREGQGGVDSQSVMDTAAPSTVPGLGSFAARIAANNEAVATNLTDEQREIVATAPQIESDRTVGQRVMVIGAGAGTGKTFTLKQLEQVLRGTGQYTAFNKSLVAESKSKFKRAACDTSHSLAYRAVGHKYKHRLGGKRVRSWEVANLLGISDYHIELPESIQPKEADGRPAMRRLKAAYLAGQVTEAIRKFCQSDDGEIAAKHFKRIDGIDEKGRYENSNKVKEHLLPFAQQAWADLTIDEGRMPFSHDVYVKIWELGRGNDRPVIAADYILLDEAQDTAPVMLSILKQQSHAFLILVGDDNQQIYEWRGAVNAMAGFTGAPRKLLSQSFRFGQAVADIANAILAKLEVPTDLIMRGTPSIPTRVCRVANPKCYLYRTNAAAIGRLMQTIEEKKTAHLIGGTDEVVSFCRAAIELQAGRGTTHQELGCFSNWKEVQTYSKEDEGADLRLMVKLIDTFSAERIIKALENMPTEGKADVVISTAHRSKGREWASVKLGQDFPTANKMTDADRRLLYVAATRAQEELDISECPPFCGGRDKSRGEDSGDEGWVPGIEIEYTAPMPSEADLASYRNAPKSASTPPPPSFVPTPAKPAPDAPTANVAAANGNPAPPPSRDAILQIVRGTAERVVTYTKLPTGEWGLWASAEIKEGEIVQVRTRTGAVKHERVGKIVMVGEKKWIATTVR